MSKTAVIANATPCIPRGAGGAGATRKEGKEKTRRRKKRKRKRRRKKEKDLKVWGFGEGNFLSVIYPHRGKRAKRFSENSTLKGNVATNIVGKNFPFNKRFPRKRKEKNKMINNNVDLKNITFGEWLYIWFETYKRPYLKPYSIRNIEQMIRLHTPEWLKEKEMKNISVFNVDRALLEIPNGRTRVYARQVWHNAFVVSTVR